MYVVNQKVEHITLGAGIVTEQNGTYITVSFSSRTCRFIYPDVFIKYIKAIDPAVQTGILQEIKGKPANMCSTYTAPTVLANSALDTAVVKQTPLASVSSMRRAFENWLTDVNTQEYSPEVILSCLDRISEYVIRKKISSISVWQYTEYITFQTLYRKLLGTDLQLITDRKLLETDLLHATNNSTYKIFVVAGKIYARFLEEQAFAHKAAVTSGIMNQRVEPAIVSRSLSKDAIDPESVIAWLITQPNANGNLYYENVVRQYMSTLRTAPQKLMGLIGLDNINVFSCLSPEELIAIWDRFKTAPNYYQVNSATSGMFSAGMDCLLRYLRHYSKSALLPANAKDPDVLRLIKDLKLKYLDKRDSGGPLWIIGGRELYSKIKILRDSGFQFQFEEGVWRDRDCKGAWLYKPTNLNSTYAAPTVKNSALDPILVKKLTDILSSHFANGYRLDSPIEMLRFRSFFAEDFGKNVPLSDEELKKYILDCGITYDGKIYAVSTKAIKKIKDLAEEYFAKGAKAIFFTEFYAKNENWLFDASVVSEDMLTGILRRQFPKLSFTQTYFGYRGASVYTILKNEILRVWGDDVLLTYEQLAERLPYISLERIKFTLGQNSDFIWSSVNTYSHISRIDITNEEQQIIRKAAMQECNARGYASITDLPFGEIAERNNDLSVTAIHNAIFRICLSDKFDKKGKIITRRGNIIDALSIIKEYCRTVDKCSLDDLLDFEKELTGEIHRLIPMEAGNTTLVRVDKETYVADRYVHFNTAMIDEAIGLFVKGDYLPLQSFTSFGAFPDCGQSWNLFLLESYCRRFSRKYRFDAPSVNSRNVGVVIRASNGMDYKEIMADAVASADIPLNDSAVGNFLFDNGYIGRSTTSKICEIIDKAKALRERRG